jgi:hypothetical protein
MALSLIRLEIPCHSRPLPDEKTPGLSLKNKKKIKKIKQQK